MADRKNGLFVRGHNHSQIGWDPSGKGRQKKILDSVWGIVGMTWNENGG